MKTKKCVTGVTGEKKWGFIITKLSQNAYYGRNTPNWTQKLKASEITSVWDYKSEGLNLEDAKNLLRKQIESEAGIRLARGYKSTPVETGRILHMQEEKHRRIADWNAKYESAGHPASYIYYTAPQLTGNDHLFRVQTASKYPVIAKVTCCVEKDWDYYAKNYKFPKVTVSGRKVEFLTLDKTGRAVTLYVHNIQAFRGVWMEEAIISFAGLKKVKSNNKRIQINDYMTINLIREIGGCKIYSRLLGSIVWGYALEYKGITYHSEKLTDLISGYRFKVANHKKIEGEIISYETGKSLGFCDSGIRQFCADNNLDPDTTMTRADLRNVLVSNRKVNCQKYRTELLQIGIVLNCK
jgi:hypothetical protein